MGLEQVLPIRIRIDPGINSNEGVLHVPQRSRTGVSPSWSSVISRTFVRGWAYKYVYTYIYIYI